MKELTFKFDTKNRMDGKKSGKVELKPAQLAVNLMEELTGSFTFPHNLVVKSRENVAAKLSALSYFHAEKWLIEVKYEQQLNKKWLKP